MPWVVVVLIVFTILISFFNYILEHINIKRKEKKTLQSELQKWVEEQRSICAKYLAKIKEYEEMSLSELIESYQQELENAAYTNSKMQKLLKLIRDKEQNK